GQGRTPHPRWTRVLYRSNGATRGDGERLAHPSRCSVRQRACHTRSAGRHRRPRLIAARRRDRTAADRMASEATRTRGVAASSGGVAPRRLPGRQLTHRTCDRLLALSWDSFFVAQVSASAALTGLVFVALSINLQRIMNFPQLVDRAAEALIVL